MLEIHLSSTYSFTLPFRQPDMSLINLRKGRGPNMDPWGTPVRSGHHDEVCPCKATFWNRLEKKNPLIYKICMWFQ